MARRYGWNPMLVANLLVILSNLLVRYATLARLVCLLSHWCYLQFHFEILESHCALIINFQKGICDILSANVVEVDIEILRCHMI